MEHKVVSQFSLRSTLFIASFPFLKLPLFVCLRKICNFGSMKDFGFLRSFFCWIFWVSFRSGHSNIFDLFVGLMISMIVYGQWTLFSFHLILILRSLLIFSSWIFYSKKLKGKSEKTFAFFPLFPLIWSFVYQQVWIFVWNWNFLFLRDIFLGCLFLLVWSNFDFRILKEHICLFREFHKMSHLGIVVWIK